MAGIGYEIRRILKRNTIASWFQAYGYAGLVSSGPWVLSILSVMAVGIFAALQTSSEQVVTRFLVSVTYLMAASLIATGGLQLLFTRFIADCLFLKDEGAVVPNLNGILLVVAIGSALIAWGVMQTLFQEIWLVEWLLSLNFVVLCLLWMTLILLSSLKAYRTILLGFFLGYGTAAALALLLAPFDLAGLLSGLLLGHVALVSLFLGLIHQAYPSSSHFRFEWCQRKNVYLRLAAIGFFFNLAIWIDKIIFWYTPSTSIAVMGPLRASLIYDLPIFLAYLSIIPGMAIFLIRMEADFSERCAAFYGAIRAGDTLKHIRQRKNDMIATARQGLYEVLKVQGITVAVLLIWGEQILSFFGISSLHTHLFYINVVSASMQVLLLSILNVLFYLDGRTPALMICLVYCLSNALLTAASIQLGLLFYGYGFALASMLSIVVGLQLLGRKFDKLEFHTFVLRP